MINFCTLFDSNYLTRGLALHESLMRHSSSFHLYVVAFNDACHHYLQEAKLPHLTVISLNEFEDEALLKVKPDLSAAEYCWTCTPSVIRFCITRFALPSCTYIDADMIFYHDPAVLIKEMGEKSVLITEHRYTKDYEQSAISGRYCVQFMCFRNTEEGHRVLDWWRARCLEWCYARVEDGKFGDQKYLDNWTEQFPGVHVLQHPGGGVAPWNVQQYFVQENPIAITVKATGRTYPLVFFHFHGLKFYTNDKVSCSGPVYDLDRTVKDILYIPYIRTLLRIEKELRDKGVTGNIQGARSAAPGKWNVSVEYMKERMILWKIGNLNPLQLKLLRFPKHYHYYELNSIAN